jgi:hypothetical protein
MLVRSVLLSLMLSSGAEDAGTASAPIHAADPAAPAPQRFELVEGKVVSVGHGVTVKLTSVMYAHLSESRNNSLLMIEAWSTGPHQPFTLERREPGPPTYAPVLGLKMAIDYVDAYHQPSTGAILVLPGT